MALFDSVNPALAQNGQGGPPSTQQNMTPPGIFSGFGNVPGLSGGQPVGLAAGLQRFMGDPRFLAMMQQRGLQPGSAQISPFQTAGPIGADVQGQRPELLRGVGMPPGMGGTPMGPSMGGGGGGVMLPSMGGGASPGMAPGNNFAGGMNPFLRR